MTLNIPYRHVPTDLVLRTNSEEHELHELCTSDTYPVVVTHHNSLLSWFSTTHKQLTIACKLFSILIISVLLAFKIITFLNLEKITYAVRLKSKYCKFSLSEKQSCVLLPYFVSIIVDIGLVYSGSLSVDVTCYPLTLATHVVTILLWIIIMVARDSKCWMLRLNSFESFPVITLKWNAALPQWLGSAQEYLTLMLL